MATFGDFLPLYASDLGIPSGTAKRYGQNQRAAGCTSATKRGRGATDITTLDAVRTFVALVNAPSDTHAAEVAKRVCGLRIVQITREGAWSDRDLVAVGREVSEYLRSLRIGVLDDLETVLQTLINLLRSGVDDADVYCEFHVDDTFAAISILPRSTRKGVQLLFGSRDWSPTPLTTIKRIDERFLSKLAAILGPTTPALPPPPY
jgi:hypothetical protein